MTRGVPITTRYEATFESGDLVACNSSCCMRLVMGAGAMARFDPDQTRDVNLVALAGKRTIYGFRQDVMGKIRRPRRSSFFCWRCLLR